MTTMEANSNCTSMQNTSLTESNADSTLSTLSSLQTTSDNTASNILSNASTIITQQNSLLQEQNEALHNKRLRNEMQLNAIEAKKNIINTRARMLQIAQENNVYKQKIIYTLIAFIFAVFIAILVMYVFYSKRSNK
jgi:VIT1/CCC1 family predicted Fe2+/Mn2+ transporter